MNGGENVDDEMEEKMVMMKWRQRWWCDDKMNGGEGGEDEMNRGNDGD